MSWPAVTTAVNAFPVDPAVWEVSRTNVLGTGSWSTPVAPPPQLEDQLLSPASPDSLLPELPFLLEDLGSIFDDETGDFCGAWDDAMQPQQSLQPDDSNTFDRLQVLLQQVQQAELDLGGSEQPIASGAQQAVGQHSPGPLSYQLESIITQQQSLMGRDDAPCTITAPASNRDMILMRREDATCAILASACSKDATFISGRPPPGVEPPQRQNQCKRTKARGQKYAELEKLIERKKAEAALLEEQNSVLRRRQRMLDTFIRVRDGHIKLWTHIAQAKNGPITFPWSGHPMLKTVDLRMIRTIDPTSAGAFYGRIVQEASRLLTLTIRQRSNTAETSGVSRLSISPTPSSCSAGSSDILRLPSSSSSFDRPIPLHPSLSAEEPQCSDGGALEARHELEALVNSLAEISKCMEYLHPHNSDRIRGAFNSAISIPPNHWHQVVSACNMTDEQLEDTLMLDKLCTRFSARIRQERQELVLSLEALVPPGTWRCHSTEFIDHSIEISQCTAKLQRNMIRERCLVFLAADVLLHHILDVEQNASVVVTSFPIMPDRLEVIHAAVRLAKAARPHAESLRLAGY